MTRVGDAIMENGGLGAQRRREEDLERKRLEATNGFGRMIRKAFVLGRRDFFWQEDSAEVT